MSPRTLSRTSFALLAVVCGCAAEPTEPTEPVAPAARVTSSLTSSGAFAALVERFNALQLGAKIELSFEPAAALADQPGRPGGTVCFGLEPALVAPWGTVRGDLADGDEVWDAVTGTIGRADPFHRRLGDVDAGLTDLLVLVADRSFAGCYLRFAPDPWSGVERAFFVDPGTGFRVLAETRWSE